MLAPDQFRTALGRFATGVTIVTARGPDGTRVGLTASSFNSVSLEPPLVLWSLSRQSSAMAVFIGASHYAINVLSAQQKDLAIRFASKGVDRWSGIPDTEGWTGAPLIEGAIATFECVNHSRHEEGDHIIFVGEVVQCLHRSELRPLLYHGGRFYTEHPL
jgi:flavin reductase (DIM6/NTAB) family NADH-FMN oxidoreductase RutF